MAHYLLVLSIFIPWHNSFDMYMSTLTVTMGVFDDTVNAQSLHERERERNIETRDLSVHSSISEIRAYNGVQSLIPVSTEPTGVVKSAPCFQSFAFFWVENQHRTAVFHGCSFQPFHGCSNGTSSVWSPKRSAGPGRAKRETSISVFRSAKLNISKSTDRTTDRSRASWCVLGCCIMLYIIYIYIIIYMYIVGGTVIMGPCVWCVFGPRH